MRIGCHPLWGHREYLKSHHRKLCRVRNQLEDKPQAEKMSPALNIPGERLWYISRPRMLLRPLGNNKNRHLTQGLWWSHLWSFLQGLKMEDPQLCQRRGSRVQQTWLSVTQVSCQWLFHPLLNNPVPRILISRILLKALKKRNVHSTSVSLSLKSVSILLIIKGLVSINQQTWKFNLTEPLQFIKLWAMNINTSVEDI